MTVYSLFITCPRGLEAPLTQELESMACQDIRAVDGGVACKGTMEQVYRINLHSRVASRVLLRLPKAVIATNTISTNWHEISIGQGGLSWSRPLKSKSKASALM